LLHVAISWLCGLGFTDDCLGERRDASFLLGIVQVTVGESRRERGCDEMGGLSQEVWVGWAGELFFIGFLVCELLYGRFVFGSLK
jgi:hypothetical protein